MSNFKNNLTLDEESIFFMLDLLKEQQDVNHYSDETKKYMDNLSARIEELELDGQKECDFINSLVDIAGSSSTDGFEQGFKAGVSLFKTLCLI